MFKLTSRDCIVYRTFILSTIHPSENSNDFPGFGGIAYSAVVRVRRQAGNLFPQRPLPWSPSVIQTGTHTCYLNNLVLLDSLLEHSSTTSNGFLTAFLVVPVSESWTDPSNTGYPPRPFSQVQNPTTDVTSCLTALIIYVPVSRQILRVLDIKNLFQRFCFWAKYFIRPFFFLRSPPRQEEEEIFSRSLPLILPLLFFPVYLDSKWWTRCVFLSFTYIKSKVSNQLCFQKSRLYTLTRQRPTCIWPILGQIGTGPYSHSCSSRISVSLSTPLLW